MGSSDLAASFANVVVAKRPTYYPAHIKQGGKKVSARAVVTVFANIPGRNSPNGKTPGRNDVFKLAGWGVMARLIAIGCSQGKTFSCRATPQSYQAVMRNAQGQVLTDATGKPLTYTAVNFIMTPGSFRHVKDSDKTIAEEINGVIDPATNTIIKPSIRAKDWDEKGSPGNDAWKALCAVRNAAVFKPGMKMFGFAQVIVPAGVTVVAGNETPATNVVGAVAEPAVAVPPPPPPPSMEPNVNGITLKALQDAGWHDHQILGHPQFAVLMTGQGNTVAPAPTPVVGASTGSPFGY